MRYTNIRSMEAASRAAGLAGRRTAVLALAVASAVATAQTLPPPPVSPTPVTKYEYDADGNPTKTIVAPDTRNFPTENGYDSLSRRIRTTNAKNGVTQFGYDLQDQLTSVTDPRSLVTQYQPSGLGDVKTLASPDTGATSRTYDAAGNLKTSSDSRGVLATYSYDALNRLKQVVYSKSGSTSRTFTWTYDQTGASFGAGVGRLTTAATPEASTTFRYDAMGRVTQTIQQARSSSGYDSVAVMQYEYDDAGHIKKMTYPSGRVLDITWANGQPQAMAITSGATTKTLVDQITASPLGPVKSWVWKIEATPRAHERVFDTNGRLVRHPLGNLVRDITYDEADRISRYTHYNAATTAAAPAFDQVFGYDELDRLTSVTGSTNWGYSYDANGNRTTSSVGAVQRAHTVQATSNRLDALANPTRNMLYDAAGNTSSDIQSGLASNYTATYSLEGRWDTITQGGQLIQFLYDAAGRRVVKRGVAIRQVCGRFGCSNQTSYLAIASYAYDLDNRLIGEYDATGMQITEYVWLGDTPVAIIKPDGTGMQIYAIHTDHLDTPRVIMDASGQVRWRWMGEPFGASPAEEQPTAGLAPLQQNLRFPGQQYEAFGGRHYNHFRDYDPTTGRYVQSDPIGLAGGLNTYAYVSDNPVNTSDFLGLMGGGGNHAKPSPAPCSCAPTIIAAAAAAHDKEPGWGNPGWQGGPGWYTEFKCNKFVNQATVEARSSPPLVNGRPATAGEIANPDVEIKNWPVVSGSPKPGDILAEGHAGEGYTGHTGIFVGEKRVASASDKTGRVEVNDWGSRPGQSPTIRRCICAPANK